ncbi:MAG: ABC transporter ATP-binding protein [Spirochaetales bacterium]
MPVPSASVRLVNVSKTFRSADRVGPGSAIGAVVEGNLLREMVSGTASSFTLSNLNLEFPAGKTSVILGPSGCGKSSLLRLLAGFEPPDRGSIFFGENDMTRSRPSERGLGMVFQDYALYPNLKAETNVLSWFAFRKPTPVLAEEARLKLERTAQLLGVSLTSLLGRMPKGLSGGERQRVALGRCLTRDPRLFLLDEPFSSLDAPLRERYRVELRRLLTEFHITTVLVTHDQQEASVLADRLFVMDQGRVVQEGSPRELTESPVSRFVAEFWNPDPLLPAMIWLQFEGETVGFRPHDLTILPLASLAADRPPQSEFLPVTVLGGADLAFGGRRVLQVQLQGQTVPVPLRDGMPLAPGPALLTWTRVLRF